jgi:HEAT repeat protein/cyclophilin family peptidyl-prolyl cis-trans isomerase
MTIEQVKELRLKRRARAIGVEVGEEGVLGIFQNDRRVEACAKSFGQRGLASADRAFDGDVTELQGRTDDIIATLVTKTFRADLEGLSVGAERRSVAHVRGDEALWGIGVTCRRFRSFVRNPAGSLCTMRSMVALALALAAVACAGKPPPVAVPPKPVGPPFEQKMAWILRLEDQRMLRDPVAPPEPPPPLPPVPARSRRQPTPVVATTIPLSPDLLRLLADDEARVRRRAALAVGRVGLADGVDPLVSLLGDAEAEVRQMAAFALGLLGDARARDPLVRALGDSSPIVQGSAAEGLGLLGDTSAAEPIGRMLAQMVDAGLLAQAPGEEADAQRDSAAGAFRLGIYALVRLKAFDQLAAAVLDGSGQPRVRWWPVAYALQRLEDQRGLSALLTLAQDTHPYTQTFAVKGLAALKDRSAVPILVPLVSTGDRAVVVEAIRALGRIGDPAAAAPLLGIIRDRRVNPIVRAEAVSALSGMQAVDVKEILLDLVSDPSPDIRATALRSSAAIDPEGFVTVLSGLDVDPDWVVRSTLASVLGTLSPEMGRPRLELLLKDSDQRVIPSALASVVKLRQPDAVTVLMERLKADDPAVRAAAANGIGELKPPNAAAALADAYEFGLRDSTYIARAAALAALAQFGAEAQPLLTQALADKDWAVRVRAATLLKQLEPSSDAAIQMRPAPTRMEPDAYQAPRLVEPSVSPQIFLETDRGTIQIELAVLEAPLTVENFIALARSGFFTGLSVHRVVADFVVQTGDPRGDGEGGPGYTIRDEINQLPYLRGTVGMALDWADTGGSQFFITHSPQPQLDARYTVFGRVISGMEVVDAIQRGDVIRGVRVSDGQPGQ